MNEPPVVEPATAAPSPQATVKKRMLFSPIWLIPILVGLVVIYVAYDAIWRHGETITLTFKNADGLVAGETPLRHKNVQLGTVKDIRLSDDLSHVEVTIRVNRHESAILTEHARFWVVRPRFSGSVSNLTAGLETLVSGAYLAVDPGLPGGAKKREFEGLEEPPGHRSDQAGRVFVLKTSKLGSVGAGSPVYFREFVVGEVLKSDIGDGRSDVTVRIFVQAPFDAYVAERSHFWNVSGLSINMGPQGLHVELQSLQAVLAGGIAFDVPNESPAPQPAPENTIFPLFPDKATSDAASYAGKIACVSYFKTSVEGLAAGASVQLLGSPVGVVQEIRLVNDPKRPGAWLARVAFDVQPARIAAKPDESMTVESLAAHPPRVLLDSVSLLTGQKVISLDFSTARVPKPGEVSREGDALVLPGETGGLENVAVALGHIAGKLEQIPFDDIGRNLDATLRAAKDTIGGAEMQSAVRDLSASMAEIHRIVQEANQNLTPALAKIPAIADQLQQAVANANRAFGESGYGSDSDFQRNAARLMKQVSEAARSVRLLADFLARHPDSVIRGRSGDSSQ